MLSYYNNFNRRTVKWWKRLFIWCLGVTQVNAFILYCLTRDDEEKPISLKKFKSQVVKSLIEEAEICIPEDHKHHAVPKPNAKLVRVPGPSHLIRWNADARNCKVCSTPKDRKITHFIYTTCNVYLHPKECFEQFHE